MTSIEIQEATLATLIERSIALHAGIHVIQKELRNPLILLLSSSAPRASRKHAHISVFEISQLSKQHIIVKTTLNCRELLPDGERLNAKDQMES